MANEFEARNGILTTYVSASSYGRFATDLRVGTSATIIQDINVDRDAIISGTLYATENTSEFSDINADTVSASYVYFPNNDFVIDSIDEGSTSELVFIPPIGGDKDFTFYQRSAGSKFRVESFEVGGPEKGAIISLENNYFVGAVGKAFGTIEFGSTTFPTAQIRGTAIQGHGTNNRGTSLDFYTTPSGSQTPVKTATFNTSSQFIETGSYGYPSLIVGDPTKVVAGSPAIGFYVSQSTAPVSYATIAAYSFGDTEWQDLITFTRDEGTTEFRALQHRFRDTVIIGDIDNGPQIRPTGSAPNIDLHIDKTVVIGDKAGDLHNIELRKTGDITIQGSLTTSENVVARTLKRSGSTTNEIVLTTGSLELYGNPIFHGDVNVYSGSAFLDQYDHQFFVSNATGQGVGFITLGGTGLDTKIQGTSIDLQAAITASAISSSGDITMGNITSNGYGVVSQSGDFVTNEFIVAASEHSVTSSDALAVDSDGNLGIGTASPSVRLHMVGEAAQTSQFLMEQYNDTADAPDIRTRRYRGTIASPQDVQTGDYLFRLNVHGYDGGASELYGSMRFDVDGTNQTAMVWGLQTRDTGGTTADRITIDSSGDVTLAGDLAINGISDVSASIASAADSGGGGAVATYTNGSNNRIITSTGTDGINGEASLTFDGSTLTVLAKQEFTPSSAIRGISTDIENNWESTVLVSSGEYVEVGTAISRTAHNLYVLGSSGWVAADADAQSTSTGLLGVAVDGSSGNDFLIRGVFNITGVVYGAPAIGDTVYVHTIAGAYTVAAPSATGDVVRAIGHIVDSFVSGRNTYWKIYFNPSPDFIEN